MLSMYCVPEMFTALLQLAAVSCYSGDMVPIFVLRINLTSSQFIHLSLFKRMTINLKPLLPVGKMRAPEQGRAGGVSRDSPRPVSHCWHPVTSLPGCPLS